MDGNLANKPTKPPDYGIDAPGVVRMLASLGMISWIVSAGFFVMAGRLPRGLGMPVGWTFAATGASLLGTAILMYRGSRVGKLRLRDSILGRIDWRGDETVLDVGCGHGLMLMGAAKRLKHGKAIGIDIWSNVDQAGNSADATRENARREGVEIELLDADAMSLPFPDGMFDVVLSSFALHNIPEAAGREKAIREIVRVLKRGGTLAIADIHYTSEYVKVLKAAGLEVERFGPVFTFLLPTYTVVGRNGFNAPSDSRSE